jgi:cytochrome c biogenesis protein CcmG/thiol:disulfide interchange protein DsbE
MPATSRAVSRPSWLNAALILLAAGLFGVFALPRLTPDPFVGKQAADFLLPRVGPVPPGGQPKIRLSELEGKAVILDFWATWCMPCRKQAPIVDRVAKALQGRGLVALGVVTGDSAENAQSFTSEQRLSYASVLDEQSEASSAFGVVGLPTLIVLDRKGAIVATRTGPVSEKELLGIAEAALR